MSDGSDGAGGVGGSGGTGGTNSSDSTSNDALGSAAEAAESLADAIGKALDSVTDAVSDAIGGLADALGIDGALGQLADALGLDQRDLANIAMAAALGMLTGGFAGAIAGVARGLASSVIGDAAQSVVGNLPSEAQPFANAAINMALGNVPGVANLNVNLGAIARGDLTNGLAPTMTDFGSLARSLTNLGDTARGLFDGISRGDFPGAAEALVGGVREQLDAAGRISQDFADSVRNGGGLYYDAADRGHNGPLDGALGDVAIAAAHVMLRR